jgi:hypothetical protein
LLPSRVALLGRYFSPPNAQQIESNTEVFPAPLRPPITVSPFAVGSKLTALTFLMFSISNELIFTIFVISFYLGSLFWMTPLPLGGAFHFGEDGFR